MSMARRYHATVKILKNLVVFDENSHHVSWQIIHLRNHQHHSEWLEHGSCPVLSWMLPELRMV